MFAQIILLENDPEILGNFCDALHDYGFDKILSFADTANIVDRITKAYTGPSILVSDYCITPLSPTVFLPQVRERRLNLPVVIVSAKVKYNQLNTLNLRCGLAGYFEKGVGSNRVVLDLAQHLVDLNGCAIEAWETFDREQKARAFVDNFKREQRPALRRLLCNDAPKSIAMDMGIHEDTIRNYRTQLLGFIGKVEVPQNYAALFLALDS